MRLFAALSVRSRTLTKIGSKISGVLLMAASLASEVTSEASAADPASIDYGGPARSFASSWTGPYAGASLGYEWGTIDNNPTHPHGVAGGLEAGFNWQNGNIVYSGEADINFSAADDTFAPWQFSNPWFGTVRGRGGIAINNVLLFGTAGLAYGKITGTTSGNLSESHSSLGWVAGLGAEMSFAQHWSAKAEWLYLDLDDRHFSVTAANNGLAANLVRLGLNYHF
jgi:outer membrane immunogenic protein